MYSDKKYFFEIRLKFKISKNTLLSLRQDHQKSQSGPGAQLIHIGWTYLVLFEQVIFSRHTLPNVTEVKYVTNRFFAPSRFSASLWTQGLRCFFFLSKNLNPFHKILKIYIQPEGKVLKDKICLRLTCIRIKVQQNPMLKGILFFKTSDFRLS